MYFDRFDICEAWYLWLADNHRGQWSDEYRRLSRMTNFFSPRPSLKYETLTENGKFIYDGISL